MTIKAEPKTSTKTKAAKNTKEAVVDKAPSKTTSKAAAKSTKAKTTSKAKAVEKKSVIKKDEAVLKIEKALQGIISGEYDLRKLNEPLHPEKYSLVVNTVEGRELSPFIVQLNQEDRESLIFKELNFGHIYLIRSGKTNANLLKSVFTTR